MKKILIIFIMFFSFLLNVKAIDSYNYEEIPIEENIKYQEEQQINNYNKLIFFSSILLIITIIIYFKYDREYKPTFNEKYLRDIPNDYDIIAVSYLMDKKVNKHCISAILIDLIRRKLIICNKDVLKKNADMDKLTDIEKSVINLIFGNSKEINIKNIKRRKSKTYLKNLNKFIKLAKKECLKYDFYEKDKVKKKNINSWFSVIVITFLIIILNPITIIFEVPLLIALISDKMGKIRKVSIGIVFIVIILLFVEIKSTNYYWNYILIFISVLIQSYIIKAHRKNKETINEYHKWLAFKNFIRDFGVFEIRNIEDVYLREKYLVYATLFGYSKKISKDVKFNIDENDLLTFDIIYNNVFNINVIPVIISSILFSNDEVM